MSVIKKCGGEIYFRENMWQCLSNGKKINSIGHEILNIRTCIND